MIQEINPERFTYENYESAYWDRLDMGFSCSILDIVKKVKQICVGYCDSSRLPFRPRQAEIAVLCEDEIGYFWFHLGQYGTELFLSEDDYNSVNSLRLQDITKSKFLRYEKVLKTKTYDPPERWTGCIASRAHLDQDEVWTIIRNYDHLKQLYSNSTNKGH